MNNLQNQIEENLLTSSPYFQNGKFGSGGGPSPPQNFLLLDNQDFLLLNGQNFELLE